MERLIEFVLNHYLLSLALAVVTFLLIQDLFESFTNNFKSLSPMLAIVKMNSQGATILDVREPAEFSKGHIEDAINIPAGKIEEQISQLSGSKSSPVIVVCQTGTRSVPACRTLTKAGFTDIYTITGGMQSWEDNKLPIKAGKKQKA
ncbi:MAG: rhodanese-like domain-containing protein [Methylicorpusculum sp.]|uniref:rhodanese-like domain-containing protein n=1 Tax=Methylicorpusculum sp. TaxID=2713644 RepID=UPI00271F191E|nr:rhodanese-like domain-containing protein [Methylicorpusculum sp.]MDO8845503.1 rhodanese-like domain-containing protein [Methylicorpusculum sp.]MDO8938667.1 rhodanese-like domain-containing protein [Methylicorpusculum sp.]MDP2179260.1 rhodanese-like domain-containing protein [Methylicorpusculum sp.]MDP2200454.1 rhodanese-like domain-containing protein [Methylicorpusculum sp.]MDP3530042.1 rhodanese-like domain-containing protein [Methylicorpusculum sp.]